MESIQLLSSTSLDGKWIALIVILCLWVVLLIVFGLLAWRYQKKINAYKEVQKAYSDKFYRLEKEVDNKDILEPISTNIKLPVGEEFFDLENNVSVYISDKKNKKRKNSNKTKMSRKELWADYDEYYGTLRMKDIFGVKPKNKKYDFPDISGNMYVTNKRILFKSKQDAIEISLNDVKSCKLTVVYLTNDFYAGFALITDKEVYRVINNDPKAILIIQQLIKGE